MQTGSRFTEYGLTGGFFWICQLILLWDSGQTQALLSNLSTMQLPMPTGISQIGVTAITSLVGALAIAVVFVTGLLLDLLAAYFRGLEMHLFHRHLVRNRDWLGRLIADHKDYCQAEYEHFARAFGSASLTDRLRLVDGLVFWNRERRGRFVAGLKRAAQLVRAYERLWSFFSSYVVVLSGSSQLSPMVDQYHLWRTARAVSVGLVIVSFENLFLSAAKIPHL